MEKETFQRPPKEKFFDKRTLLLLGLVIVGTVIYSLGVVWFLNLGTFFAGGITGISQITCYFIFGEIKPFVGVLITLFNIPLFILGWRYLSLKFAIFTLISVLLQTAFITLFQYLQTNYGFNPVLDVIKSYGMTADTIDIGTRLFLALLGGFFTGIGNALCLRSGGSSGGMDVVANAFQVRKGISLAKFSFIVDGAILIAAAFVNFSTMLFTMVRLAISILTIDRFYRIYQYVKIEVITEYPDDIRDLLLKRFFHSMTIIDAVGGYSLRQKKILEIYASRYEVTNYVNSIRKVDPQALITVSNVSSLTGNYVKKTII